MAPERNSSSRNCTDWNPLAGASRWRNSRKSCGVIVSSTSTCETSTPSTTCARRSRCEAHHRSPREHRVPRRGEVVQQLLEPQLVDLVDGDEQQLVVGRRVGLGTLARQQPVELEVGAVGQQTAFLAEAHVACGRSRVGHPKSVVAARPVRHDGRMKVTHTATYDAPAADVYAMLTDPAFRQRAADASGVVSAEVTVEESGGGHVVTIDQVQPTEGVPAFAKKFAGDTTRAVVVETWTTPSAGHRVDRDAGPTDGDPGHLHARGARRPDHPDLRGRGQGQGAAHRRQAREARWRSSSSRAGTRSRPPAGVARG